MIKKVLSIAGSDSSGGAGIQADIKTVTVHKMYAMSVITALTAQNTQGVYGILECGTEFVEKQLDAVFNDIFPDSVKIGMTFSAEITRVIIKKLKEYGAKNIVADPVMVSTSGSKLLCDEAVNVVAGELLPAADIITPNIPEAEILCGFKILDEKDMIRAAEKISEKVSGAILIKGGHLVNDAVDLLYADGKTEWFRGIKIDNPNTHGTGCTMSSAFASFLAKGLSLHEAAAEAKKYINDAIVAGADYEIGHGYGPVKHFYRFWNDDNFAK